MTYMVIYRSADGKPSYHHAEALEDAVRHVEHLRNTGTGTDPRIFRMHEVPIEVKTYYRVEVAAADEAAPAPAMASATPAPAAEPTPAPPAAVAPVAVAPTKGEPVGAGTGTGRFGLFNRA